MSAEPKLNDYEPGLANAKVSVAAMWKRLEALESVAEDPVKVKAWAKQVWNELGKCEVAP
jgi:hypothetical protein